MNPRLRPLQLAREAITAAREHLDRAEALIDEAELREQRQSDPAPNEIARGAVRAWRSVPMEQTIRPVYVPRKRVAVRR